jgi:hypothetical protein
MSTSKLRSIKMRGRQIWKLALAICLAGVWQSATFAAEVVYIRTSSESDDTFRQVEAASTFYGLEVNTVYVGTGQNTTLTATRDPKTVAVVIDASALSMVRRDEILKLAASHIPLLIAGITEKTDPTLLNNWSSGVITDCRKSWLGPSGNWYVFADVNNINRQLSGINLPIVQSEVSSLTLNSGHDGQWLIDATHGAGKFPIFVHTIINGHDLFFATEAAPLNIPVTVDPYREQAVFAGLAAPMVFLRYAAGERAWHSSGNYANFTIDDIWLKEPYGYVNYDELLQQAQQHNFHATAAFIPWNFDRSQPGVVSLFRSHPDRLSICIHGNNHLHQEFGPLSTHPLPQQVADIKQALARMERFSQLTHIPYDPVMVFPHSISPTETLEELKRYNFLATANSLNIPSDAPIPVDVESALRAVTMQFANFPSLRRYSAETDIAKPQLAIDAFLGNPILFYAHEGFFSSGMGAFDPMADTVNRLQPGMQWKSLGYIARHLYLEKLRDDGNYDVAIYSSSIDLSNPHSDDAVFFVRKNEDFSLPLTVLVDGKPYPFQHIGTQLLLQLPIHGGSSRDITIKYGNDLNLAAIDISHTSFTITAVRKLSDFRDDVVSKTALGRRFIRSYADNGNTWNRLMAGVLVGLIISILVVALRRWRKREREKHILQPAHSSTKCEVP